jgi:hypothetical protein
MAYASRVYAVPHVCGSVRATEYTRDGYAWFVHSDLPLRMRQATLSYPQKRGRTGFDLRFEIQAACRG